MRIPSVRAEPSSTSEKETVMKEKNLRLALLCGALVVAFAQTSWAADAVPAAPAGHVIHRSGDTPSARGTDKWFVGNVRQDAIAKADEHNQNGIIVVTFEPGARTFWHLHPAGQRLLVTFGKGLVGTADGKVDVVRPGDYVWCPPDVRHWHGAAPETAMSHIALTNTPADGPSTEWFEALADEEYARYAASAVDPLKK